MKRIRTVGWLASVQRLPRGDVLLAAGMGCLAVLEVFLGDKLRGPLAVRVLAALAIVLPLAWRGQAALAASTITIGALATAAAAGAVPGDPPIFTLLAFLLATYAPAAYEPLPRALAGGAVALAGMSVFLFGGHEATALSDAGFGYGEVAVAWALGRALHRRDVRGEQLEQRALRLEHDRELEARRAVAEERTRIARELHDVVAHGVSLMVVQAQAGQRVLRRDGERAGQAFAEIETAGRQALVELERMLGVMRAQAGEDPALTPHPRLGDVHELIERARSAGLAATLRVEGEPRPLSRGLDLAAYRVVQEAVTNAIKHGPGGPTEVLVCYGSADLELRVANELKGSRASQPGRNGTGHGLIGMRERVTVYEGRFEAGVHPDGRFVVRAVFPLDRAT